MDAVNGVATGVAAITDAYEATRAVSTKKNEEVLTFGEDTAEISEEAKEAQKHAKAIARADRLMQLRGLSNDDIKEFRDILQQYEESGKDAKEFLKSLDYNQKDLVKRANSYGTNFTDRDIDSWTDEGAENMLREQDWRFSVDLNNDGIVDHGAAETFVFPPPNSPDVVKDAWDIMADSMTEKEQMLFTMRFLPLRLEGYPDATTIPGYNLGRDGFPEGEEGWLDLLDAVYESEEDNLKYNPDMQSKENSKKMMGHLTKFKEIINSLSKK